MGAYFAQWSVYGRGFSVKQVDTSGQAAKLTFINYAFGNIYKQADGTYQCQTGINVAEPGATDPNAAGAGTGGDAFADYDKAWDAASSVSGVADVWNAPIAGNFGQLKELKAKYPNLKVFISLGGWSWSKYFSAGSATAALRQKLVSSCIDTFIKGNLASYDGRGGAGAAAGVFDGIDIDWEYPGVQGVGYNTVDATNDGHNFTLLMQEFRSQLDALGGAHKPLTFTVGAGQDKLRKLELSALNSVTDWVSLMAYDYHGGWEATGPTDFNANLYPDPASPNVKAGGDVAKYSTDDALIYMTANGMPANKILMGLPFYGRGWTGVGSTNNGLYQTATGKASGLYEAGINDYKVLAPAAGTTFVNSVTKQLYKYDGSNWWSYDDASVITTKINYAKSKGLKGVFAWELDGDDTSGTLTKAMGAIRP